MIAYPKLFALGLQLAIIGAVSFLGGALDGNDVAGIVGVGLIAIAPMMISRSIERRKP